MKRGLVYTSKRLKIFATLLLTLVSIAVQAQEAEVMTPKSPTLAAVELRSMSEGSFEAFSTDIEGASAKLAEEEWKDFIKEYGGKVKRSKPEKFKAEAVILNSVAGANPVDVFADFDERGKTVKVWVWFKTRDEFMGRGSTQRDQEAITQLLADFNLRVRKAEVQKEIEAEQRELDKLNSELDKLARDLARYEQNIEKAKEAIQKNEADIESNKSKTAETKQALEQQSETLKAVQEKYNGLKS